jgi:hypothetical protein
MAINREPAQDNSKVPLHLNEIVSEKLQAQRSVRLTAGTHMVFMLNHRLPIRLRYHTFDVAPVIVLCDFRDVAKARSHFAKSAIKPPFHPLIMVVLGPKSVDDKPSVTLTRVGNRTPCRPLESADAVELVRWQHHGADRLREL